QNYKIPRHIINFFLQPPTISFPIPLYPNHQLLKKYSLQIFRPIPLPTIIPFLLIYLLPITFQFPNQIIPSILPQPPTTPIPLPLSHPIRRLKQLTSLPVILNPLLISALGA
ncbi:LrgB family protein, partial [Staphylococcus epidermidis]|uniref:LrgB family protein n=1 Tax=Staphylococcus epidermidis TaxID=1282 RepID=UPI0016433B0C